MNRIACTRETTATPNALWKYWADVENWPTWDAGIEWARLEGEFKSGTKGTLKPKGGPRVAFVLLRVDPLQGFSDESRLPLGQMRFEHHCTRMENGRISFTHQVSFHGLLGGLYALLIGASFLRDLPKAMEALAALAEGDAR